MASMVIRRFVKVGGLLGKAKKHGANVTTGRSSGRISYGFYCVENPDGSEGSVVAPKAETDNTSNMRLFGVFDRQIECLAVAHLQSHFLATTNNNHNESKIRRCTKAAIRNAYKTSTEKSRDRQGAESNGGFATLLLSSNRKIIMVASSSGFEVVLCKGGTATPVGTRKSVSDLIPCIAHKEAAKEPAERLMITTRDLEPGTSFIILASNGIWEVLGYQEAVHLLNHIKDAQKAAECLAEEAITRLSKSNISCLIIRF